MGGQRVAVIATMGVNAAKAAQIASRGAIPVVFALGDDPVALGLVASLNRPGANITGISSIGHTLGPKRVKLLRELLPAATVAALLTNPKQPRVFERRDVEEKVRTIGWQLRFVQASGIDELRMLLRPWLGSASAASSLGMKHSFLAKARDWPRLHPVIACLQSAP